MTESRVALGLWPIAGITTVGVTPQAVSETMNAAIDAGITTFDTAFSYGYDGESDRTLGKYIQSDRGRFHVIGKVGQRWTADRQRVIDGTPETLTNDAESSLQRIGIETFDLLMLHSPDPSVPIERSAAAMRALQQRGLCHRIGVCNVNTEQLSRFQMEVGCDAIQCPLNLLQRDAQTDLIPACIEHGTQVHVYWTLMKGLLAGRISRDHIFAEGDSRPNYAVFQGAARDRAHRILDQMTIIAKDHERTIAQLSIGWALAQPGINRALVGAHHPAQVREIALARPLSTELASEIDRLVESTQASDH
ncbi:MAG: aldo/keto reductase [Rubripirellula sp.]